jgi:hypothetical protein
LQPYFITCSSVYHKFGLPDVNASSKKRGKQNKKEEGEKERDGEKGGTEKTRRDERPKHHKCVKYRFLGRAVNFGETLVVSLSRKSKAAHEAIVPMDTSKSLPSVQVITHAVCGVL